MLEPAELLDLVDDGARLSPVERGIRLWQVAEPEVPAAALWAAPVGCLEHALFDVRTALWGSGLELVDRCLICREEMEFQVDLEELRLARPHRDNLPFAVELEGRRLSLRRVSCSDFLAIERGEVDGRRALIERCIVSGSDVEPAALSEAQQDRLDALLAEHDPQADVTFSLVCPCCEHRWVALFDIGAVVWSELEQAGRRLLHEIDALARTYHWSEAEIIALPPRRRRRYLELISG